MDPALIEIHTQVHALRLLPKYKPSVFEQNVNKIICEVFAGSCNECKERLNRLKYQPLTGDKPGFLSGIFGGGQ